MPRPAITVENLSKAYHIGLKEHRADTLVGTMQKLVRAPLANFRRMSRMNTFKHQDDAEDVFWALKDVNFEVAEGEVVGIIGRNGAGKSTLLKILSRITEPTAGRATIRGRVSSLLEVGTGFHQELTGRENVYMNGTILGMTRREIDAKFDEIVDFSGVEKFLDTPIKHYSSGMKVRLAFSVAAHLEPEILIIDEVLAVGDLAFQSKCLGKMGEVAKGGRTALFVSHNMAAVESLCSQGILLDSGRISLVGSVQGTIAGYRSGSIDRTEIRQTKPSIFFSGVSLLDFDGNPTNVLPIGATLRLRISLSPSQRFEVPRIGIGIDDEFGVRQLMLRTPAARSVINVVDSPCHLEVSVDECPLSPGVYSIKLSASRLTGVIDSIEHAAAFTVVDGELFDEGHGFHSGRCVARAHWKLHRTREPLSSGKK